MSHRFVHLRLHSEYSLSDGMVRIKPLVAALNEKTMPAVAVTDQCNFFALVKFYQKAQQAGIKPLVASDVWVRADVENEDPTPMVLYAKNKVGYSNLTQLLSRAYQEGNKLGKPSLRREWVEEHSDGLLALSGGKDGGIGRLLLAGRAADARDLLAFWMRVFPQSYYLEVHRTRRENEEAYLNHALELAAEFDCPVVATNDVRFLKQEEYEAHEARVCIHEGRTLDDPRRERRYSSEQYLKSEEQMLELFEDIPQALENTVEIAKRCNVEIDLGNYYLPEYPIPEGSTTESYFTQVSKAGLEERLARNFGKAEILSPEKRKAYDERLDFELGVINKMGFAGYFLIVMEFIQWAREQDIPVGPGRGSGPASLVAYSLQITDLDPLKYDLLFERFLNPERVSLPDFDIDFCMDGRDRVIAHVTELYGKEAVSQIITFGTMAAKAVVRDVARVQGKPYGLADKLSKLIPFDPGMTLEKALEQEPLLKEFVETNDDVEEIMEMAFKLEGLARNVGKHAGGVVIAPNRITDFTPVYCDDSASGTLTQFDKDDVEQAGLVKFDFLGLRTLTIIKNAVRGIDERNTNSGEDRLDIEAITLEDNEIYQDLKAAKTTAVFQLESRGMKDLMKKVKPNRFADIVALVALFRPGPMQLADDFIKRKSGEDVVDYLHPDLEPVLQDTYGVMLYQEQVMQIAQILAGYTLADADLLRRAMGKKKPEEMAKQREVFLKGAIDRGVDGQQADHIFNLMEKFAGYGFNKPHSVAYARIAYQTAWLKHYYPSDFMAAVLSADMQNTDKIVINVEECREMKLKLLPPGVNRGGYRFKADGNSQVVYGLGAIKGLGVGPIESIVEAREKGGCFKDLFDLCERVDSGKLNRRAMEALIGSGALDELVLADGPDPKNAIGYKRSLLTANLEDAIKLAEQKARNIDSGHTDLFGDVGFEVRANEQRYNHIGTIRDMPFKERLAKEKETLGLYLTGHPIDIYAKELRNFANTRIVDLRAGKDQQTVAGLVVAHRTMKNRKGETIAFVTLDDRSGRTEVAVFADVFEKHHEKLQKDRVLVVKGVATLDDFSGGIKITARELFDLLEAREKSVKALRLSLHKDKLGEDFIKHLAGLLEPFKARKEGGCPVSVAYYSEGAKAEVMLGEEWRVSPADDLLETLRRHYGNKRVLLRY